MTEPASSELIPFAWVYKRDGRLVPFEADRISRALFAASESLGRSDAFLARELTDSVLHFLPAEIEGIPTTGQIADTVVKVVRELGQPALAQAFAEGRKRKETLEKGVAPAASAAGRGAAVGPSLQQLATWVESGTAPAELAWRASGSCLRAYSLQEVFARDLAAAHRASLLTLAGLEAPLELDGCVLGSPAVPARGWEFGIQEMVEAVQEARALAGNTLSIDAPEQALAHLARAFETKDYVRGLATGLGATGLRAVVNLNSAAPPSWAADLAEGPLFAGQRHPPEPEHIAWLADRLLEQFLLPTPASARVRVDWHLGDRDFRPGMESRLLRLARLAADGAPLSFSFDRPNRPVPLAEGLDRTHPAILLRVGLHLPRLLEQIAPQGPAAGARVSPALFNQKLGSLARLALTAAVQKREFLRRLVPDRPALSRGFLLDRSRLVVIPVGLDSTVRCLTDSALCTGSGTEMACQILRELSSVLQRDGRAYRLETCLDSAAHIAFDAEDAGEQTPAPTSPGHLPTLAQVAGLTPWDTGASPRGQVRAAGLLHASTGAGTAAILVPLDQILTAGSVVDLLRFTWQQTDVTRLRLLFARDQPAADLPFAEA